MAVGFCCEETERATNVFAKQFVQIVYLQYSANVYLYASMSSGVKVPGFAPVDLPQNAVTIILRSSARSVRTGKMGARKRNMYLRKRQFKRMQSTSFRWNSSREKHIVRCQLQLGWRAEAPQRTRLLRCSVTEEQTHLKRGSGSRLCLKTTALYTNYILLMPLTNRTIWRIRT